MEWHNEHQRETHYRKQRLKAQFHAGNLDAGNPPLMDGDAYDHLLHDIQQRQEDNQPRTGERINDNKRNH